MLTEHSYKLCNFMVFRRQAEQSELFRNKRLALPDIKGSDVEFINDKARFLIEQGGSKHGGNYRREVVPKRKKRKPFSAKYPKPTEFRIEPLK